MTKSHALGIRVRCIMLILSKLKYSNKIENIIRLAKLEKEEVCIQKSLLKN